MGTLKQAYEASNVTASHREFVWDKVNALTVGKKGSKRELLDLLRLVWTYYDNGGHSCGRSRRSVLLESCLGLVDVKKFTAKNWHELRIKITILVSMYHDDDYIEKMGWYDRIDREFRLISSVRERVHLMAAFTLLRLTELTEDHYTYFDEK